MSDFDKLPKNWQNAIDKNIFKTEEKSNVLNTVNKNKTMKDKIINLLEENSFNITPYEGGETETVIGADDMHYLADEIINLFNTDFKTASTPLIKYK